MNINKGEYIAGEYDVAVIGAGHAGCEAALASVLQRDWERKH